MESSLTALNDILESILDPEISALVTEIGKPGASSDEYVRLPDTKDVDLSPQQVSRLIATSSNKYRTACRLAGIARARFKIAEARYKYKVKANLNNSAGNQQAREATAMQAAEEEHEKMVFAQAIVELCESFESANRIASESARRMLLSAEQMRRADNRVTEHAGSLSDNDFTSW